MENEQDKKIKSTLFISGIILAIIIIGVIVLSQFVIKEETPITTLTNNEAHVIIDELLDKNATSYYLLTKADRELVVNIIDDENVYFETELLSLLDTTLTQEEVNIIVDNLLNRANVETFFNLSDADQNLVIITIISSGKYPDNDTDNTNDDNSESEESIFGDTGYKGWNM